MYKVTRFYSEPQDKTTVQIESQSVDSANYDYFVRILDGDYREKSDEEVVKTVLDMVRIKLNPNEALVSLDEKLKETDDKIKEMDDVINKAERTVFVSNMAVLELTEMVYTLLESMSNIGGGLSPEPEPLPGDELEPEPGVEDEPVDAPEPEPEPEPTEEPVGEPEPEPEPGDEDEPGLGVDDLPDPPSEPGENGEADV